MNAHLKINAFSAGEGGKSSLIVFKIAVKSVESEKWIIQG